METIKIKQPCPTPLVWMKWDDVIEIDRKAKILPVVIFEEAA